MDDGGEWEEEEEVLDLGYLKVDVFRDVVRKRRYFINVTIVAYVFIFLSAFVAIVMAWNVRNARLSQRDKFDRMRMGLLIAAIFAAFAGIVGVIALIWRTAARAKVLWLPMSLILLILTSAIFAISALLFYLYTGAGLGNRGNQMNYLKAVIGMGTFLLAAILLILLFGVGLPRDIERKILAQ